MTLPCASRYIVLGGGGRSLLAEVDEVGFAVGIAQKKESASAEISGLRMDDGERKSGGDGGVDRIASGVQHFDAGAGREFVDAGDHGVRSMGRAERGSARSWRASSANRLQRIRRALDALDAHELGDVRG